MKKISYIPRTHNVVTQEETLESLHTFKNFPVYIGCTKQDQSEDILADLSVAICMKTGIMQLDKVLPLELIYGDYHSEALGGVWNEHHLSFVEFVNQYNPKRVLEIGGSNGFIAKECVKHNNKIQKWVMVEPAPAYEGDDKIEIVAKNFDENFRYTGAIDTVVHSHTFEHIYEPGLFMEQIGQFMNRGTMQIFSVPNLKLYLENKQANWINFEHNVYLAEHYIDYLLVKNGFEILEKRLFTNHSIFYATKKVSEKQNDVQIKNLYAENKQEFEKFIGFYKEMIKNFNSKVSTFDGNVYLFGAHIFSQFMLLEGLKGNIDGIVDNSKLKEGKRLYGTPYTVFNPRVLQDQSKVAVILRAGAYQEEVRAQITDINPETQIWE